MPAEDLTFTAQWTPNVYNITYNAKPGAIRGEYPTTYTYGVPQTLPTDVNRFGYLFCGWRNAEGELLTEIAAGTIGDVALTADWGDLIVLAPTQPDAEGDDCYRGEGCPMNEFSDLDPHAWYHDGIHYALAENLMNGLGDGIFAPDAATSRAMVVTILYRVEGAPAVSGDKVFSDVSPDAWYGAAVSWAAANGIVEGHEDGTFRPNDAITREQMAAILYRYAAYKGEASVEHYGEDFMITFPDKTAVSAYAVEAMNWACAEGLINGMDGILNPRGTATRAQAAAILFRYLTAEK